jgi:hypothetical protein
VSAGPVSAGPVSAGPVSAGTVSSPAGTASLMYRSLGEDTDRPGQDARCDSAPGTARARRAENGRVPHSIGT